MANSRFYTSIAQQTTLTGGVTASDLVIPVASTAGFPGSTPFTLAIDYGAANMELVEVTSVASLSLTVTRAVDGTSASGHSVGAVVRHVASARDFTDSRTHEAASTNVHGLSGGAAVVGTTQTQTLTNKTLTRALGSLQNITMFNTGASGITQIIGDSANPTANRLEIKDNEVSLNILVAVQNTGNVLNIKSAGQADNIYKFRMTDSNGTTDRWAVLAGGTQTITPNSTTTFVPLDIVAPDLTGSKRTIRVAANGGLSERFTTWNDGHVNVATFGMVSGTVLNVASNAGFSGNILNLVGPGGGSVARVDEGGNLTATGSANVVGISSSAGINVTSGTITANGNISSTGGSLSANTTISAGGNISTGSGNITTTSGNIQATSGTVSAQGNITSTAGNVSATLGNVTAPLGKVVAKNLRAGTATAPAPGATPAQTSVNVTFSSAMSGVPSVVVTPSSTAANLNTSNIRWAVTNEATTGFTINCWRDTNNATIFNWFAVVE